MTQGLTIQTVRARVCGAAAACAAMLFITAVEAQECQIDSHCLRAGAGAIGVDQGDCDAQFKAYRACLAKASQPAAQTDPALEQQAERAYGAVKSSGDPALLELVATRFPGTFWGVLAAEEAKGLRAAAAAPAPQPAPAPKSAPEASPPAQTATATPAPAPADNAGLLRGIQSELRRLGYYRGAIDGLWGPQSRGALSRYQSAQGLNADGAPNAAVLATLRQTPSSQAVRSDAGFDGPIVSKGGVAIGGYDPVAYYTQSRAIQGDRAHTVEWSNVRWRFASAAHLGAFIADPQRYAPQFGGHCAYCLAKGTMTDGDPRYWVVEGGKLYLHSSSSNADAWRDAGGSLLSKARAEWRSRGVSSESASAAPAAQDAGRFVAKNGVAIGGYDPVVYFTQSAARKGSSSITQQWSGATWRFVSDANRRQFASNPSKYAPQFGGHCSYCMSKGSVTDGDGRYWNIVSGRLYLHSSQSYADNWPREYAKRRSLAERKWREIR